MTTSPIALEPDPLPLARDSGGVIRVAATRVTLESLVLSYLAGASARELAEAYPDVSLPDIHASIAYYLRHREEIDLYIAQRQEEAENTKQRLRTEFPEAYQEVTPRPGTDRREPSRR